MAAAESKTLQLAARVPDGSRTARRLRREGRVPGVIYGTGDEPQTFSVDARILRNTLAHSGAILEVSVDGSATLPVLVKDVQRHPVRGEAVHVDFLRVRMDEAIHTQVTVELLGGDSAPGVVEGGVLSQETLHLNIEALPGDLPDVIQHDVSALEILGTVTLGELRMPPGVKLLDDPDHVLATITPPSPEEAPEDEIETETELVGDETAADAQAAGDTAEEAAQKAEAAGEDAAGS